MSFREELSSEGKAQVFVTFLREIEHFFLILYIMR